MLPAVGSLLAGRVGERGGAFACFQRQKKLIVRACTHAPVATEHTGAHALAGGAIARGIQDARQPVNLAPPCFAGPATHRLPRPRHSAAGLAIPRHQPRSAPRAPGRPAPRHRGDRPAPRHKGERPARRSPPPHPAGTPGRRAPPRAATSRIRRVRGKTICHGPAAVTAGHGRGEVLYFRSATRTRGCRRAQTPTAPRGGRAWWRP